MREHKGPRAIVDGRFYPLKNGEPQLDAPLQQIDLAPDDPDDGSEKFVYADPNDPPQAAEPRLVELDPETAHAAAKLMED